MWLSDGGPKELDARCLLQRPHTWTLSHKHPPHEMPAWGSLAASLPRSSPQLELTFYQLGGEH